MDINRISEHLFPSSFEDLRGKLRIGSSKKIGTRTTSKIKRIVFHCTDANGWTPFQLNDFFLNERRFPTCGYHYYVMRDRVYYMVSENVVSYHASGYNSDSISFSIDYNATFEDRLNIPIDGTILSQATKMACYLCFRHHLLPDAIKGHRELKGTGFIFVLKNDRPSPALVKTCPGLRINLDDFRLMVAKEIQMTLNELNNANLVVDGIIGPVTKKAFEDFYGSH